MISNTRESAISIRRDDVSITDAGIIARYMGIDTFPCKIKSPLREDDSRPSFSMQEKDGRVFWKDFGTGNSGDAVSLMSKLWNVSYKEALLKIKLDTDYKIPRASLLRRYNGKVHLLSSSTIKVVVRDWKSWDIEFWESFGISKEFCTWCNVHPVSHALFTKDGKTITVPMDKYAYAYFEWKDGKESIKLYQPFSETMKWLSKHDASVWDLWKQAFTWAERKSDSSLIITSSRKDAMCIWNNLYVPAISMQGEGYLPKPQVMQQIFETFKTVYIWYDNDFKHKDDNPGQDNARKLKELYPELHNIYVPTVFQCKDPSDLVKSKGIRELKRIWKNFQSSEINSNYKQKQ